MDINFSMGDICILIIMLILFVLSITYATIMKWSVRRENEEQKLLDYIKGNYKYICKGIKVVWFIILFISIFISLISGIGSDEVVNFNSLTKNDFLFFFFLVLCVLPLANNVRIKTPFGDAEVSNVETDEIIERKEKMIVVTDTTLENQVEVLQKRSKKDEEKDEILGDVEELKSQLKTISISEEQNNV